MPDKDVVNVNAVMPDFTGMQRVQTRLFELIDTWGGDVLAGLGDRVDGLRLVVLRVERAFEESLAGAIVLLAERQFAPSAPAEQNAARLSSVMTRLHQHHAALVRSTLRLELYSLSALEEAASQLTSSVARLDSQTEGFTQRLATLREQHTALVDAIGVFQRPSVMKAFKGLIPSDTEIDQAMGLIKDPKIDAGVLKSATAKLRQLADVIEEGKTLNDLINARARLHTKIDDAVGDQQRLQSALKAARAEQHAVTELLALDGLRTDWLTELRKVETHWQVRVETITPAMTLEASKLALDDLCDYFNAVQLAYDRS